MSLLDLSWRAYPAAVLLAAGAWALAWSARLQLRARRRRRGRAGRRSACSDVQAADPDAPGPRKALDIVRGIRAVLVGAALVGTGAGWIWQIPWLVGLSLIIGGQELLETSVVAAALRDELRRRGLEPVRFAQT
jgi:hypothetical protein